MLERLEMEAEYKGKTKLNGWDCHGWVVTLYYGDEEMTTPYYTGLLIQDVELSDVMNSLFLDADVRHYSSFEEWARDYGYDTDSRSAERTYKACLKNYDDLRGLLGDDYD